MGNKTYFKPRARLMLELGEQLIKNESGWGLNQEGLTIHLKH